MKAIFFYNTDVLKIKKNLLKKVWTKNYESQF